MTPDAVARFGYSTVVTECIRVFVVRSEHGNDSAGRPTCVLVVVASVEPSAVEVLDLRNIALGERASSLPRAGLRVLSGAHMARSISPIGSGRRCGFFETSTLVEVHPHGMREHALVHAIVDLELDGTQSFVEIHDRVRPRDRDIGEIKPPGLAA